MWVMPCIQALPDHVALDSCSTELGDVNTNLYACMTINRYASVRDTSLTLTKIELQNKPFHGSLGS